MHLTSDSNLVMLLITDGAARFVSIREHNRHSGLSYSGLPLLVHQLLQISHSDLLQVGNSHNETDRVQDIGFPRAIVPRNGIEHRVEVCHRRPRRVRLKPLQTYLFDVHSSLTTRKHPWQVVPPVPPRN